ncbi:hypothetical protein [Conchiformibius steedae]|uniref:Uncharacterized protein n=1 Tax=Conchiformibius steedae TaxID=153493 RepID=A0A3P2A6V4_9NEIS|nr:hypothetical protein [Conchiformibius steedae]RRD89960.1 hypothetical protein EII21_07010 [Conchiformibius steedae]
MFDGGLSILRLLADIGKANFSIKEVKSIVLAEILATISIKSFQLEQKILIEEKSIRQGIAEWEEQWKGKFQNSLLKLDSDEELEIARNINLLCYNLTRSYQNKLMNDFSEFLSVYIRYEFMCRIEDKKFFDLKEKFLSSIKDARKVRDKYEKEPYKIDKSKSINENIGEFYKSSYQEKIIFSFMKDIGKLLQGIAREVDERIEKEKNIIAKIFS